MPEECFRTQRGVIYLGDALEVLEELDVNVDAVITDPPYGSPSFEWDKVKLTFHVKFLEKVKDVMKDGAPIFMFYPPLKLHEILPHFSEIFRLRNIIVWHHPNIYAYGKSYGKDRFKSTWEAILYGIKGNSPRARGGNKCLYNKYGKSFDVIIMPAPPKPLHPAQKPEKLIERFVTCFTNPHDLILDPFLGSGTTALVAEVNNRRWIGIEISEKWCEVASRRLKKYSVYGRWW